MFIIHTKWKLAVSGFQWLDYSDPATVLVGCGHFRVLAFSEPFVSQGCVSRIVSPSQCKLNVIARTNFSKFTRPLGSFANPVVAVPTTWTWKLTHPEMSLFCFIIEFLFRMENWLNVKEHSLEQATLCCNIINCTTINRKFYASIH